MERFDTYFVWIGQVLTVFREENVSHKSPMCISGKITTIPRLFSEHSLQNENKHQIMNVHTKWKLFDTYFVWIGQVLAVSGKKTLVIRHRCV